MRAIMGASLVVAGLVAVAPALAAEPQNDAFLQKRRELRLRKRRVILNNDGCDCLYFPKDLKPTPENFLARRTSPLAGSHVDAVFYCTISSGFSNFTHATKVGHILTRQVGDELNVAGKRNVTQALIDQGTDPLKLVQDWCHENGLECFWSFRMNDTHDGAHRPTKEYPLFPKLKAAHPEYMIGTYRKRPRHGSWTSVNYALPAIRDLAFQYIEEVCRNYDVDGIELDFCRHLSYFPSVAFGGEATDAEREMMTSMLRRVRAMAEREGRTRGRPILIATRVPDSIPYCRAVGLDLEQWLKEDLIDILVGGFYMRLNPWEYLAELGKRYNVAVYAGLSESRVRGDAPPFSRNSMESYRGRAMRAWQAGVHGVYLFNFFDPAGAMLSEIGEPDKLRTLDKIYYATIRNRNPNGYLAGGKRFQTIPILTPQNPMGIRLGETRTIQLAVGGDVTGSQGSAPDVKLHLQLLGADSVVVRFNGTRLTTDEQSGRWTVFPVDPALLKPGTNAVAITAQPKETPRSSDAAWNVVYSGTEMPKAPWSTGRRTDNLLCDVKNGALFIADRGKNPGDYLYWAYPWNVDPADETVVEARAKVVSGWNNIIVANGTAYERVSLYPDRVSFYEAKLKHAMDTTGDFHTYRVVMKGKDIRVFVDGTLALDGTGRFTKPLPGRNDVRFGAANSPSLGEAYWQYVKLRFKSRLVTLYDMVLSVRFPQTEQ